MITADEVRLAWEQLDTDRLAELRSALQGASGDARATFEELRRSHQDVCASGASEAKLRIAPALYATYDHRGGRVWALFAQFQGQRDTEDLNGAWETLRRAQAELDAWTEGDGNPVPNAQALRLFRAQLWVRFGLIDRANDELEWLRREPKVESWILPLTAVERMTIDIHLGRWDHLVEWLTDFLEDATANRGTYTPRMWYVLGQATYERDHAHWKDAVEHFEHAIRSAREHIEANPKAPDPDWPRVAEQAHLRWARTLIARLDASPPDDPDRPNPADVDAHLEQAAGHSWTTAQDDAHRATWRYLWRRRTAPAPPQDELLAGWARLTLAWREAPPRTGGMGLLTFDIPRRIAETVLRATVEQASPRAALEQLLEAQRAASMVKLLRPEDAHGPRPNLPRPRDGESVWVWFPGEDELHAFALVGDDVRYATSAVSGDDLLRDVALLRRLIGSSPRSDAMPPELRSRWRARCAELGDQLFPAELRDVLERTHMVTVVGADLLGNAPVECLGPAGLDLATTHAISYLPALPLLAHLSSIPDGDGSVRLLTWLPDVDVDRTRLDALRDAYLPPAEVVTSGSSLRALERRASLVQVLAHGVQEEDLEDVVGLALWDGALRRTDILQLSAVPQVVVLLACESGRGPLRAGDGGIATLAGSLLLRGASAVVLPDARIEAGASLLWSTVWHAEVARGSSPAEAALEARRTLVASGEYADPYYHSLIHVVGDGHRPVFRSGRASGMEPPTPGEPLPVRLWLPAVAGGVLLSIAAWRALNRHRSQGRSREGADHRRR